MIQPTEFGKFILLERVSVGGMAEVYRAKLLAAPEFERFFAIKRILPHLAKDTEFVTMFINEAKVAVELEHPNVCQIYELGRLGQSHYIAMEYIAGRDVEAIQAYYRKQKKIMSVSQACFIMAQAAQGLDYAHRAVEGLVHRDVSPQNLLVTYDGVVKLIDFGVSKASRKTSHSQSGVVKGKFSYMSPEQATDSDIDHRSDIFALGVIFWELLTGRRLFQSESEFAIMEMIRECKIEKPSKYNRTIPEAVERICMKALEKDLTKRYQWGSEMVMDLFDFINSCKTPFTQWHLQNWMCKVFDEELKAEWEKIPIFKSINTSADIEKYNREHAPTVAEGASVAEARTEDSSALPEEVLSQISPSVSEDVQPPKPSDSQAIKPKAPEKRTGPRIIEAKPKKSSNSLSGTLKSEDSSAVKIEGGTPSLPPVPGRGPRIVPSIAKNKPSEPAPKKEEEPKKEDLPEKDPAPKAEKEESAPTQAPCLSIAASLNDLEEDIELEPEDLAPEVSDPQLAKMKLEAQKARTRKSLMSFIVVISIIFTVSPVIILGNFVKLPKPEVELPTSASVQIEISPDSPDAKLAVYLDPKESNPTPIRTATGSLTTLTQLSAGEYSLDLSIPGYEPETYKFLLENKNYTVKLDMMRALPEDLEYKVTITPEDARVYINDQLMPGTGAIRTYHGIIGTEYTYKILKAGYAPKTETIKLSTETNLSFDLGEPQPVSLTIHSAPQTSEVFIKEAGSTMTRKGVTPLTLPNIKTAGPLEIEVRKPGHQTWRRIVDFEKLEQTTEIRLFADMKTQ